MVGWFDGSSARQMARRCNQESFLFEEFSSFEQSFFELTSEEKMVFVVTTTTNDRRVRLKVTISW